MSGVELIKYNPDEWFALSEDAHRAVFKEVRPPWMERISFAVVAMRGDKALGYATCRETDRESLYWHYGGCLDEHQGYSSVGAFRALLEYTRAHYRRCSTLVSNDNVGYLHLLMKHGFRVIGLRCFKGEIFLELFQEFEGS